MIEVVIQYTFKGKPAIVNMGHWEQIPLVGDEIAAADGILTVTKRRWKVDAKSYERHLKVALLCDIQQKGK